MQPNNIKKKKKKSTETPNLVENLPDDSRSSPLVIAGIIDTCISFPDSPDFRQERAGGEGGDRGPDGWMTSPTQWT